VSPAEELRAMADVQAKAGLALLERAKTASFDPTAEALEHAHIAGMLRLAAAEVERMAPAEAQDYLHRMKFAVWQRLDDSPEVVPSREDPL
jgi:hypothetical protein